MANRILEQRYMRWRKVVEELYSLLQQKNVTEDFFIFLLEARSKFGSLRGKNLRLLASAIAYVYLSERGIADSETKEILRRFAGVESFRDIRSWVWEIQKVIGRDPLTAFRNVVATAIAKYADEDVVEAFYRKLTEIKNPTLGKIARIGYKTLLEHGHVVTKIEFAEAIGSTHQILLDD